jgi:hypothetical protein
MREWVCPKCKFWIGLPEDWGEKSIACPACDLLEVRFESLSGSPPQRRVPVAENDFCAESFPSAQFPTAVFLEPRPPRLSGPNFLWQQWLLQPHEFARLSKLVVGWALYAVILLATIAITGVVGNLGWDEEGRYQSPGPCQMGFLSLVWISAVGAFRYARRFRAKPATAVTRADPRPPVLILRAFADDQLPLAGYEAQEESWVTFGTSVVRTFEEYLHNRLSKCGPVIACGRPGWTVPPLGAARFWIRHEHWQKVIRYLLDEAQYVVMIVGELVRDEADWENGHEDGLLWEARRVAELAQKDPTKVVLVLPPVDDLTARRRWAHYQYVFGAVLPEGEGDEIAVGFGPSGVANVVRTYMTGRTNRDARAYDLALRIQD